MRGRAIGHLYKELYSLQTNLQVCDMGWCGQYARSGQRPVIAPLKTGRLPGHVVDRYKSYLVRRYCSPNERQLYYSHFCLLPTSRTFVLKDKGKILGTITLIVDTPSGLPIDSIFAEELTNGSIFIYCHL